MRTRGFFLAREGSNSRGRTTLTDVGESACVPDDLSRCSLSNSRLPQTGEPPCDSRQEDRAVAYYSEAGLWVTHLGVVDGDTMAREEICERVFRYVRPRLKRTMWTVDPTMIEDGLEDALLSYLNAPTRYDSTKSSLEDWIAWTARCRIIDSLRKQSTLRKREVQLTTDLEDNRETGDGGDDGPFEQRSATGVLDIAANEGERAYLLARLAGERSTLRLAAAAGLDQLPALQQRRAVKQLWDRLRAKAIRKWRKDTLRRPAAPEVD